MYDFLMVLKIEFLFTIQNKKNYFFQATTNYIERIIFLSGMILLLGEKNIITIQAILKCAFWFILVNSFLEISQRIESEIRLKQFDKCFNCKSSFWMVLLARIIPVFFDSLFITLISSVIVKAMVHINFNISLVNVILYIFMMTIQYLILMYIYAFIGIYFQRIQAVMGLVESYTFFYSGIVVISSGYSLSIFKMINRILENDLSFDVYYLFLICLEFLIVFLGMKLITQHIKMK